MPVEPRIRALKTAVPPFVLHQPDVRRLVRVLFSQRKDIDRLMPIFDHTGIETRYSCVPIDWYEQPHGWPERTRLYAENSVTLLEKVARDCLDAAEFVPEDIDAIVVASTTGVVTPSLDALIAERLPLRRDVQRLPIFGLGCAGGLIGLARAASLVRAYPHYRVLFLVVEMCGLSFRAHDLSKSNLVAAALFGDGAAGAILTSEGDGPVLGACGEYTWKDSLDIMGWEIKDDGLKARFSRDIPALVDKNFHQVTQDFLRKHDISWQSIHGYVCHPGGAKVLNALERAFGLEAGALVESRSVLREFGNMSAPTALFVLERTNPWASKGRILMTALGPGFTAAYQVIETS